MTTLSRVEAHKNFDAKVRNFVGKDIYAGFINLGVKINHVKKICIKLKNSTKGGLTLKVFKEKFLEICERLVDRLSYMGYKSNSSKTVKKVISDIFLDFNCGSLQT